MKSTVIFIAFVSSLALMPGLFRMDAWFYVTLTLFYFHIFFAFLFVRYTLSYYWFFAFLFFMDLLFQFGYDIYMLLCYLIFSPKPNDTRYNAAWIICTIGICLLAICIFLLYNVLLILISEKSKRTNANSADGREALERGAATSTQVRDAIRYKGNVQSYEVEPVVYAEVVVK